MSPDRSEPRVRGSGCGRALFPALIQPSHGPTPPARILTITSPEPGSGRGTRSNRIASGGPNAWTRHAIIDVSIRPRLSQETLFVVIGCTLRHRVPSCRLGRRPHIHALGHRGDPCRVTG